MTRGFCLCPRSTLELGVATILSLLCAASSKGATLTLDQAIQMALDHNPSLEAAAWHVRGAQQHTRDQSTPPNPSVEITAENFGGSIGGGQLETTVSVTQVVGLGGKIGGGGSRARLARRMEQVARAELTLRQREILVAVENAYLNTWWLERRVDRLDAAERIAGEALAEAKERTRLKAAPPTDALRAQGLLAERRLERRDLEAELDTARRELTAQWGATAWAYDSLSLPPPDVPRLPPPEALLDSLGHHPERVQAAAQTALEIANVAGIRSNRAPDLAVTAGLRRLEDLNGTAWVTGVEVDLPLWNRGSAAVRSAEAERAAAGLRERVVQRALAARLFSAYDSLMAARDEEVIARTQLLPATRDALSSLQQGYRAGRFTYLDQLEGQRAALDAELAELQVIHDLWSARFSLEELLGASLESVAEGTR